MGQIEEGPRAVSDYVCMYAIHAVDAGYLLGVYNDLLQTQTFQIDWKAANVILLMKSGKDPAYGLIV